MSDVAIPGRNEVLLSSVVFVIASLLLLFEFTSIGYGWPAAQDDLVTWNWFGVWSCVGWFVGFALLIDWLVFSTFPVWGFDRVALIGAILKLIASVLFCIQPMSYIFSGELYTPYGQLGTPWSNFAGICFFHAGNMINAVGMLPLINLKAPLLANFPPLAMIVFASATWFLVIADGIYYFGLGGSAAGEAGQYAGPGFDISKGATDFVSPGQVTGATLLLVGSLMYTAWSALLAPPKQPEPLLRVQPVNNNTCAP